jgi:mono/diheme cytochrome c family protein
MKAHRLAAAILGVALTGAFALASAAEDMGKAEYNDNCAICHGKDGKGDGPYTAYLKVPVPDITTLQKRYSGVFPFNHVYEVIDGREAVKAHGSREMPIWGNSYNEEALAHPPAGYFTPSEVQGYVRGRILALINYIYSLQEK